MSHFGFVAPPLLGHLNPMQALAATLVARGHRATFFGMPEAGRLVEQPRFGFVGLGAARYRAGSLERLTRNLADPRGLKLFRVLRDMAGLTDMLCREAPDAVRHAGIDAVVSDQIEPAGGLVADALDLPLVSVANALLINREPAVPPAFTDWPYDPGSRALWKNQGGYRVADLMMVGLSRTIARHAAGFGLAPRKTPEDCLSRLAQITQTVPGFDFPRAAPPAVLQHCGPLRGPEPETDVSALLRPGRPLVFASLGTLQGGRLDVFRTIAAACEARGLHLVIAHGGRLTPDQTATLPGHPLVRDFVPQRALLRHAALAITNGGLNTVLDALAAAVPVIAIPIAFEQGAIAARLAYRGVGIGIPLGRLTSARLEHAIDTVLDDAGVKARTRALALEIAAAGGVERAAAIVEEVARSRSAVAGRAA